MAMTGVSVSRAIPPATVSAPQPGGPQQFGLFSVARMRNNPPREELNGVEYEPVCNTRVDEWPMNCRDYRDSQPEFDKPRRVAEPKPPGKDEGPEQPYGRKLFSHSKGLTNATPFTVYAGEDCFLGNHNQRQALDDLRERFTLGEEETVERVIYDGLMGVNPALRYKPEILTTGGVNDGNLLTPIDAIGLLEHWLAHTSGAQGVIHAPRFMGAVFPFGPKGKAIKSPMGHDIVHGTGYSGAPPFDDEQVSDEAPDKTWLYATRPVTVRRSDIIQPADYSEGAFSKRHNSASLLMERVYVVDWPCEVAAIQCDYPRWTLETRQVADPAQLPEDNNPNDGDDDADERGMRDERETREEREMRGGNG